MISALDHEHELLTGRMKRTPIVQDRQPQGCGCRAYTDVFTACLEQWVSFSSVSVVSIKTKSLSAPLRLCGNKFLNLATLANIARRIQIYDTHTVFKRLDQHGQ